MNKLETYGQIKDGKLHIIRRDLFMDSLKTLPNCRCRITIEKVYKKRSNPQNAYLWGVVYPILLQGLNEVGYNEILDIDEVHDFCKTRFLKKEVVNEYTGEIIQTIGSTKKLTTLEFSEYLDRIKQFADEYLHYYIPEPNEETEIFEP